MELIRSSYRIVVDFNQLTTLNRLHNYLKEQLGFFEGYGANVHALIDCLSSLRYADDGMVSRPLLKDESIVLVLKGVENADNDVLFTVLLAVGQTNKRYCNKGMSSAIYLDVIKK